MRKWTGLLALVGTAFASLAAVDVTTDTTLSADTDWSDQGQVTVAAGATLDLNGHALKVAGLNCAGTITSTPFYRRLEYIESTSQQWIDTGFLTTAETAIDFDFTTLTDNGNHAYFCGDWAGSGHLFVANWGTGNTFNFFGPDSVTVGTFVANTHFRLQTIPGGTKTVIFSNADTGTELGSSNVALTHSGSGTMMLFAAKDPSTGIAGYQPCAYRLHSFTLTQTNVVERELVPVERTSDGKGGLLDLAHMVFYPSEGSADFVKGPTTAIGYTENDATPIDLRLDFDLSAGGTFTRTGTCTIPVRVLAGTLAADADLRSWGTDLTFAGSLALNGHRLSVATLDGATSFSNVAFDYRRLTYIESTGKQWIDTGFLTTAETAIDLDFTYLTDNGNRAYFCADWDSWGHLLVVNGASMKFFGKSTPIYNPTANTHYRFKTDPAGTYKEFLWNGDTGALLSSNNVALTHSGSGTMMLFAARNSGTAGYQPSSYRLHRFTLTHQGTVVRDLVPVERVSDGKGGLYDTVNQVFYPSAGSEDFVKGTYVVGGGIAVDNTGAVGELYLEDEADAQVVNTTMAMEGNIRFIKAGAGAYTETLPQANAGGVTLAAGTLAFGAEARALAGALTLAGGTLAITEDQPLVVTNGVTVTAPTTIAFTRTGLLGKKTLITGCSTSLALDQLALTVTPSIAQATRLAQEDGQLVAVLGCGANEVVKAVWNGTEDGDITKPANWTCTNADGETVTDGLPFELTRVEIGGTVAPQIPSGTTLAAGEVIVSNCTLSADCDWRGLGAYTIMGTLDLAGHKLWTTSLTGTGTVRSGADSGYRYYRFKVDATSGANMQISEISLLFSDFFASEYPVAAYHYNETSFPSNFKTGYNPTKAVDGNSGTKWFDNRLTGTTKDDVWVTIEYVNPVVVGRYWWTTGDDTASFPDRNPVAWRLQASNDNTTWTDLDVVTNFTATTENKTVAYRKNVDSHLTGDGSELHVEVAANQTTTLSTVKLAGQVKLVKDGAGTLVAATHGQTYCGGTEIASGILKPGMAADDTLFGVPSSVITVCAGAQFYDDIFAYCTTMYLNWVIAGTGPDNTGAIRATKSDFNVKNNAAVAWGLSLTLADDATIAQDEYAFDFLAPNYLPFTFTQNGHALTIQSAKTAAQRRYAYFLFSSVQGTDAGTIVVGDNITFFPYMDDASVLPETTLILTETSVYYTGANSGARDLTVSNLVYRCTSAQSQTQHTTFVLGRYAPESTTSAPKVQLGDETHLAPTLDLSTKTEAYDVAFGGGLSFMTGAKVNVEFGNRRLANLEKVLSWTAAPENVSFECVNREGALMPKSDGLYYATGLLIIIR